MQWQAFKENIAAPCYFRLLDTLHIARHLPQSCSGDAASEAIYRRLATGEPCMMCRYGSTEVRITEGGMYRHKPYFERLKAKLSLKQSDFAPRVLEVMETVAGFFPVTVETMERFTELTLADSQDIDILGVWCRSELSVVPHPERILRVPLADLEPYFFEHPWSRVLAGKKVLVIHPFAESIRNQYARREKIFANPEVLPEFELQTYAPVNHLLNDASARFGDWFGALDFMQKEISELDFDVALIGAGAYGFSLAAHVKRMGRQGIHLGGALQILFGIAGKRWDRRECYRKFYNEYWCRPNQKETPKSAKTIEGGCYW